MLETSPDSFLCNYVLVDTKCHSERSEESRGHPRFVFSRSFLPTVVWMTTSGNLYMIALFYLINHFLK